MTQLSRLILGLLFIFSGFVKAIDPVGNGLVFDAYFDAFGLDFLKPLSIGCGVVLSSIEFLMGVLILLDFRKIWVAWGALLFMGGFTLLTLYLALFNPVSDCGCFGEAVKLTNWQTFIKNLIFLPFALILFVQRRNSAPLASPWTEWAVALLFGLLISGLSVHCYRHQPLVDFMGFRVGNHIPTLLEEAAKNPSYTYETDLVYAKEGKERLFSIDSLPDSSWTFVRSDTKEVFTGKFHKVTSFAVFNQEEEALGNRLLSDPRKAMVLLITSEKDLNTATLAPLVPLVEYCRENDTPYYVLSALEASSVHNLLDICQIDMPVYYLDKKTLLTVIRATPGLMVLQNGTVLAKYAWRDFPTLEQWQEFIQEDPELVIAQARIRTTVQLEIMAAALLLVLFLLRKGFWFARVSV